MLDTPLIQQIRTASRLIMREPGSMNTTLAITHYSPSVVHALLEVSMREEMTATQLVTLLGLKKSGTSRMVSCLLTAGELEEHPCAGDARTKSLTLAAGGHGTMTKINTQDTRQMVGVLDHLDEAQQHTVATGLAAYTRALVQCRDSALADTAPQILLMTDYQPGMIGRIAQIHGGCYARHHNSGTFLEGRVASGVVGFVARLSSPVNQIWLTTRGGRIIGSLAIDGESLGQQEAHLHWFILDDSCRGSGTDRRLLNEAMTFCDSHQFSAVQLWTFKELDAARRLYESLDFALTREWQGEQWGKVIAEQQFTRSGNTGYGHDALAGGRTWRLRQLVRQAGNLLLPLCLQ